MIDVGLIEKKLFRVTVPGLLVDSAFTLRYENEVPDLLGNSHFYTDPKAESMDIINAKSRRTVVWPIYRIVDTWSKSMDISIPGVNNVLDMYFTIEKYMNQWVDALHNLEVFPNDVPFDDMYELDSFNGYIFNKYPLKVERKKFNADVVSGLVQGIRKIKTKKIANESLKSDYTRFFMEVERNTGKYQEDFGTLEEEEEPANNSQIISNIINMGG